jgi:hypothetical protein
VDRRITRILRPPRGSGNVSSHTINPDGSLTSTGSTPIRGGGADIDARLSPDGKYLLVDGSGNHTLRWCRRACSLIGNPA